MNDKLLKQFTVAKYLGIFIDDKLSWAHHVQCLCKKNSQKTGIFYKSRNYLSKKSLVSLNYSFIYPHLLYGILTWGSACKSIIKTLQVIQNKMLRIISNVTYKSAVTNNSSFYSLNILKIRDIYKLELATCMYKYHSQMLPNTFEKYFNSTATTHCYETRNAYKKNYVLPQIRTNQSKNSLQFAGVQVWNSIQPEWKNISFSCFKRKIKQMLITKFSPNNTNNC